MKKIYMTLAVMLTALYGHAATPEQLYIIGSQPLGAGWEPTIGNECERIADGKFTYSLSTDDFAPGECYFGFTTTLASEPSDWATMNEGDLFRPKTTRSSHSAKKWKCSKCRNIRI